MAITISRYVNITSGVAAGASTTQRELIARLFSVSASIPTESVVEFTTLADVGDYFGTGTEEYRRAQFYFGFVSKNITRPKKISFARWASLDTAPLALGAKITTSGSALTRFSSIDDGEIVITLGTITETINSINLGNAESFADVANTLQSEIRSASSSSLFSTAVVTFNATQSRFELTCGVLGPGAINIQGTAEDQGLSEAIGWGAGVRLSNGVARETITDVLEKSTQLSNNFGSFCFVFSLGTNNIAEAAAWNNSNNVLFQYHIPVLPADAETVAANVAGMAGCGVTLKSTTADEYPEMLPMAVLAATDYTRRAAAQNYMFQRAALTPTVTSDADANAYDALGINYYGETQTAGQRLAFYQRGVLMGTGTAPLNMNTFANEQWLKDFATKSLMDLLIAVPRLSANTAGRGQAITVLRDVVSQALLNGVISVGKTLTSQQRIFIGEQTGDENAFQQVQSSGYWLDATIRSTVEAGVTIFTLVYVLIYAKDDVIRRVEGSHVLV